MPPITIVVNAQTAEAARELSSFVTETQTNIRKVEAQSKASIDEIEKKTLRLKAALGGGWGAMPSRELADGSRTAADGLNTLTRSAGLNRMAMMQLGSAAKDTAIMIAMGASPGRILALQLPQIASGAAYAGSSLGTLGLAAAALLPVILSGAQAWSAYKAKQEAARTAGEVHNQVLDLTARNLAALNKALDRRLVSPEDFVFLSKLLSIGTESSLASAQARLAQLGISEGQMDKLEKLQSLEKEMTRNAMESHEAERAKAYDVWRERMQQIEELAKASKMAAGERKEAERLAGEELGAKVKKINADQQNEQFKKELEFQEQQQIRLLTGQEAGAKKRQGLTQEEFDKRIQSIHELSKKYPESEAEVTRAAIEAIQQRNQGMREEAEARQQLRELGQTAAESALAGVDKEVAAINHRYDQEEARLRELMALQQVSAEQAKQIQDNLSVGRAAEVEKAQTDNAKIEAQKRLQIKQDEYNSTASLLGSAADAARLFGREGFAVWKALALAQAVVSGASAVLLQLGGGDPYSAPFRAAAAAAAAAIQIATIAAAQPSGFMGGGYTGDGATHDPAGVVHRREFVVNAERTAQFRPLLEAIHTGRMPDIMVPSSGPGMAAAMPLPASGGASRPAAGASVNLKLFTFIDPIELQKAQQNEAGEIWVHDVLRRGIHRYRRD